MLFKRSDSPIINSGLPLLFNIELKNVDFHGLCLSSENLKATDELLLLLSNGRQIILSEFGHTDDLWKLQPEATVHFLTSFYDTVMADESLYTQQSMDFHVGLGSPEMAKIILAVTILIIMGLAALVWIIVRKLQKRRGLNK